MPKLPVVSGKELIKALGKMGFLFVRQRGDHVIMKHSDERVVTIPLKKEVIPLFSYNFFHKLFS